MGSLSVAGNLGLGITGDEVFSFSGLFSFGSDFFVSVFSRVSRPERIVPLASVVSGGLFQMQVRVRGRNMNSHETSLKRHHGPHPGA